ncbi:MAG: isocitrate/isopropylmalate family dehydrogenase, partial [Pseudonocardiaceae bacterium]
PEGVDSGDWLRWEQEKHERLLALGNDRSGAGQPAPSRTARIIVLEGDETGQELLEQALRVLDPAVIKVALELEHYDLSLDNRRRTDNEVVTAAAHAIKEARFGLKAATITPEGKDDIGSPNRILREGIDGKVIIRTGRRIPGVTPVAGVHYPIAVVRMAVGDAYGAKQWREEEDGDEVAYRTERISRSVCRAVAEYSFRTAQRIHGRVYGGPKWTVSPVYEGLLKEEMDAASERHPEVPYSPVLIDATYAGLISGGADAPLVIPALNRDGDCLSDLVMPMFGSIAGAESVLLAFDEDHEPRAVMAEAPHGTAPALQGKDIANPMAMILAAAALLAYIGDERGQQASRAIREAALETVSAGTRTADLGGHATTTEFTDEVISRVRAKIEVWATLSEG